VRRRRELPFRVNREQLANGLRVVTVELPHLHTASVVMYAKVGSRYETPATNGLSHFLEHMLFRGTEARPDAYALNRAIEEIGGTLYAETGRDYSLYQISLHPESLLEGIALFGEIFCAPAFCDVEVERRIVLEEMLEDVDENGRMVNLDDLARLAVWRDHPLGWPITGPAANVERFTRSDVRRHFAKFYGARNMVLCLSGRLSHEQVFPLVRRVMAGIAPGAPARVKPPVNRQRAARFQFIEEDGPQTSVQLLFRALPELDPEYPALMMLARLVDDGMSTRLHRRLVDELGLAYYVSSSLEPFVDAGLFEIDATAQHESVPQLAAESLALVARLRDELPPADELQKAQRRYRWDLERSFDDADAMASWWCSTELFFNRPPLDYDRKVARVERVQPADVQRVAQRIFRRERLVATCVGSLSRKLEREVKRIVEEWR
jgi:predicted Zn-dependent peptidase